MQLKNPEWCRFKLLSLFPFYFNKGLLQTDFLIFQFQQITLASSLTAKTLPTFSERQEFSPLLLSKPSIKRLLLSTLSNCLDHFQRKQKDFCLFVRENWFPRVLPVLSHPACFPGKLVQVIPNSGLPLISVLPLLLPHFSLSYHSIRDRLYTVLSWPPISMLWLPPRSFLIWLWAQSLHRKHPLVPHLS